MSWKLIALLLTLWAAGMYFSATLHGLLHILPVVALVMIAVQLMGKNPNSEFGRWKPYRSRASNNRR